MLIDWWEMHVWIALSCSKMRWLTSQLRTQNITLVSLGCFCGPCFSFKHVAKQDPIQVIIESCTPHWIWTFRSLWKLSNPVSWHAATPRKLSFKNIGRGAATLPFDWMRTRHDAGHPSRALDLTAVWNRISALPLEIGVKRLNSSMKRRKGMERWNHTS